MSRWYFGSLARLTFSVRVCHTRTYKTASVLVQPSPKKTQELLRKEIITFVQLFAFGSSSSTVVICFRKSDSCIPGWEPRRLNTAFGCDRITWRLTANPWRKKKWLRKRLRFYILCRLHLSLEISMFLLKTCKFDYLGRQYLVVLYIPRCFVLPWRCTQIFFYCTVFSTCFISFL